MRRTQYNGLRWTRRGLLTRAGSGLLVVASIAGCDRLSTDPSGEEQGNRNQTASKGKEAPSLADQVGQGSLPPVEQRLPANPVVVEPVERPGVYGGSWRVDLVGLSSSPAHLTRTMGYEQLMRLSPDGTEIVPNVAEGIEASEDGRAFTISLREGVKWSDGEPLTADDVVFAYEDVARNETIRPVLPRAFVSGGGTPAELEKLDELTVVFTFAEPNGLFVDSRAIARLLGVGLVQFPRHYLEQFHETYNPDVQADAEAEGYAEWPELFLARSNLWENSELPRLHAWVPTNDLGDGNRVIARRNPYYFKVDPEGSQLPYIDEIVFQIVNDEEVSLLNATNGELDFQVSLINTPTNKPVLAQNRDGGDYDFNDLTSCWNNEFVFNLNLAHSDAVKREIFQNRDFRIGLSYAINREELIDAVFQQQGEPWQPAPARESEFFDEELATQYTEFSVDQANEHLDRAGFVERDDDGFRLGPDGNRITFAVDVATAVAVGPNWVDALELIVGYWEEVGIEATAKAEDRSLFFERIAANQHDAAIWNGDDAAFRDEIYDPRYYFPFHTSGSRFAIPWAQWFESRGRAGEEPPEAPRRQIELYWELMETPDRGAQKDLYRQILEITKEQFYVIGTLRIPEHYGIVKNNFRNVPGTMLDSAVFTMPAMSNTCQFFIEE